MKNSNSNSETNPLTCLSIIPTTPPAIGVWVNTERKPNGSYRTIAYVNGSFYACSESRDKQGNIDAIREALAEGGHQMPIQSKALAPVMSAKLQKRLTRKAA